MNDEQLKTLLKQDQSTPVEPVNQWSHILTKIESKKSMSLKWLVPSSVLASLLLMLFINNQTQQQATLASEDELIEFFLDDFMESKKFTLGLTHID